MDLFRGIGISGYRSFSHTEPQLLGPLEKMNLVVGQNNAGKSNVLRFMHDVVGGFNGKLSNPTRAYDDIDIPSGSSKDMPSRMLIAVKVDEEWQESIVPSSGGSEGREALRALDQLLSFDSMLATSDGITWLECLLTRDKPASYGSAKGPTYVNKLTLDPAFIDRIMDDLKSALTPQSRFHRDLKLLGRFALGGNSSTSDVRANINYILIKMLFSVAIPNVDIIQAFRQIRPGTSTGESGQDGSSVEMVVGAKGVTTDNNGLGLIDTLARYERPDPSQINDKKKFARIEQFVRSVLDDPSVNIEIPYHRKTILVEQGGRTLPIESLGTGIQEVVILAAAATTISGKLICMEEPEIHLHPILQRKLLRYLAQETDNQYVIATHSAHMLDSELATIFHVTMEGGWTRVSPAVDPVKHASICADLGYRPSDLVQSNCVIWVEGPSDRIYLQHWISLEDPALIEGVHYSIMFYGGSLLSHLSAKEPAVKAVIEEELEEFIYLRRINRRSAIVIDSDRKQKGAHLNRSKQRVIREFDDGQPGLAWVTDGYTVENYVPVSVLDAAVAAVHPRAHPFDFDQYDNPLDGTKRGMPGDRTPIKAKVAREVINIWDDLTQGQFNLQSQVRKLVRFIRAANDLPENEVWRSERLHGEPSVAQ